MSSTLGMTQTPSDIQPSRRWWGWLFLISLGVRLLMALMIPEPGYMDTAYYTAGGVRLAEGTGATEPFIWNYLAPVSRLPVPAFGYWMPLPALLVAPAWVLGGSFLAAQIPFAVLSALFVVLGAHIAWEVIGNARAFWAAGGLLLFSPYFFPFWTLPETFAPFALFGTLVLWALGRYWRTRTLSWCALAATAATLAYLSRSDGLLLVMLALTVPVLRRDGKGLLLGLVVTGMLLAPWIIYNLQVRGTPLPTGGTATLWLTDYDDIFCYHCDLSLDTYLAWGWRAILKSKLDALVWNLQTLFAAIGAIILAPFALVGAWSQRRRPAFVLAGCYLLLLFTAMTFAFTYPGPRGGLFHSGGALLPFVVTVGLVGLDRSIAWVGAKRGWQVPQAQVVFTIGIVLLTLVMSGVLTLPKIQTWRLNNAAYHDVGDWLRQQEPTHCPVLVGDAPRFWVLTRIPALTVPNEDVAAVTEVAQRYGACWLYLDKNRPKPLADFYKSKGNATWTRVKTWDAGGVLYRRGAASP